MNTPDYSHMRVIVIDDDEMVLRSLKLALSQFGFSAMTFKDPAEALNDIEKNGADIVISDIRMPKLDGFEVLKRAKNTNPECEVIFITAHGQLDTAIRALREGAADFFEKPFTTTALTAAMARTNRFRALEQKKRILSDQIELLNDELRARTWQDSLMIGRSPVMEKLAGEVTDIAASNATVLIAGESGTGKELVAHAIHRLSPRAKGPFITLNCASVPEDLFESEMFGHRRGSFTGAVESRGGYVDAAGGGTLFLDEIGELPLQSQAKILRLLEQKSYMAVGEQTEKTADVRVVAATNQSLEKQVNEKRFREDLYHRLLVCRIVTPPLRDRKEDIPVLALYFTLRFAADMGKAIEGIDNEGLQILAGHDYPGNVRELRNIIEAAVIRCKRTGLLAAADLSAQIEARQLPLTSGKTGEFTLKSLKFADVELHLLQEALSRTDNNVSAAARLLGLSRGKLRRKLAALGISD